MPRLKPPPPPPPPPDRTAIWLQKMILKMLSGLQEDIASNRYPSVVRIEKEEFVQFAVSDSSVVVSTVRPAEQHVWVQTGGGTKSGLLKKFEIIKSMVIKFEKKIILLKSDERLWKSERMKFLKRKNKIERKLRRVIKLVNEWEVQASTERKTSVIIKDCGLVIIGHINRFTFIEDSGAFAGAIDTSLRAENIVYISGKGDENAYGTEKRADTKVLKKDLESCKTYDVLEHKEYFGYGFKRNNPASWICKRLQYNENIRLIAGTALKSCIGLFIREKHSREINSYDEEIAPSLLEAHIYGATSMMKSMKRRCTVEQRREVHVSCSKEQATILSKIVHATTVKAKLWWRPPFRQKWRAHDLDIPLQLRVGAVDGLTDDDDDNTDEEYEDTPERFSVVKNLMREVHDRLTRMPEIKTAVTVSLINCQHVVIGETNEMSFVYDEDWLDSASAY